MSEIIKKNVLLVFNQKIMYKPIIYRIARDFDIVFNLLEAKILPKLEGRIIMELSGHEEEINRCLDFMRTEEVTVMDLADKIHRDDEKCTDCGACTALCVTGALYVDRSTMEVLFDSSKCIACGICTRACPVRAMSSISIDLIK